MEILDCTLRDGGYYTKWNFSKDLVNNYLRTVSKLPINNVELGYFSNNKDDNGLFYHLNEDVILKTKKILRKNQKIYAMINLKEISNNKEILSILQNKGKIIDGIRFAVPHNQIEKFLSIIILIRKNFKNLKINANIMYLSKWWKNEEILKKIFSNLAGKVDAISFVDSYGSLTPKETQNFFYKAKDYFETKTKIGCHFHNNSGLALANSLIAYDNGCQIIDSTFTGMGRGAGNAETELLLGILSSKNKKISGFELNFLLEQFTELKKKLEWGSSFAYAFAAANGFSQSEMMDLIQNRRLDPGTAVKVISNKKKNLGKIEFNNIKSLKKIKNPKYPPVIIGGGSSFLDYGEFFFESLNSKTPIVLSGSRALFNFVKLKIRIKNPTILILSGSEIKKITLYKNKNLLNDINLFGIIAEKDFFPKNLKLNKKIKLVKSNSIALNPILLSGLAFKELKIKNFNVAFFDGNPETEKGRIVMKETQESIIRLKNLGVKSQSLTNTFLDIKKINSFIND